MTNDLFAAVEARDRAIAAVAEHAPADWMARAAAAVRGLARNGRPFTTDEVWMLVGSSPPEPRALGAVMKDLSRANVIVPTGEYRRSTRPECHARPVQVWRGA